MCSLLRRRRGLQRQRQAGQSTAVMCATCSVPFNALCRACLRTTGAFELDLWEASTQASSGTCETDRRGHYTHSQPAKRQGLARAAQRAGRVVRRGSGDSAAARHFRVRWPRTAAWIRTAQTLRKALAPSSIRRRSYCGEKTRRRGAGRHGARSAGGRRSAGGGTAKRALREGTAPGSHGRAGSISSGRSARRPRCTARGRRASRRGAPARAAGAGRRVLCSGEATAAPEAAGR